MASQAKVNVRDVHGISAPPAGTWEIDPQHTTAEFVARHMLTKVRGRFTDVSGSIEVAERPEDSRVHVEIGTDSVTSGSQMRDDHLRNSDFFEVETYPKITFESTAVRFTGGNGFELDGDLTIRDVTKPITLEGEFLGWGPGVMDKTTLFAEAGTTVEREDWGLTWNMAVETGGMLVGKKVDLELQVQAKLKGE
jgi:polyisoprenoid-binding protein YceI